MDLTDNQFRSLELPDGLTQLKTLNLNKNPLHQLELAPHNSAIVSLSVVQTRLSRLDISVLRRLKWLRVDPHVGLIPTASELITRGVRVEYARPTIGRIERDQNGVLFMIHTANPDEVLVFRSSDLIHWENLGVISRAGQHISPGYEGGYLFGDNEAPMSPQLYYRVRETGNFPPS